MKRLLALTLAVLLVLLTGCTAEGEQKTSAADAGAVAGDYYLNLSQLGMKLTIYLRISENGRFQFSNTTDFTLEKSAGTVQKGEDKYMMVYESVNGEDKTLSEGVTSSFRVNEDGSLDFSVCERIFYGSASAVTVSEDDPNVTLVGVPLPEDYQAASTESQFRSGVYMAHKGEHSFCISFYDDNSYLLAEARQEGEQIVYTSESGIYGVSTTQLALTPTGASRLSGEVLSDTELMIPIPENGERTALGFALIDGPFEEKTFSGALEDGTAVSLMLGAYGIFTSAAKPTRKPLLRSLPLLTASPSPVPCITAEQ